MGKSANQRMWSSTRQPRNTFPTSRPLRKALCPLREMKCSFLFTFWFFLAIKDCKANAPYCYRIKKSDFIYIHRAYCTHFMVNCNYRIKIRRYKICRAYGSLLWMFYIALLSENLHIIEWANGQISKSANVK